MGNKPSMGVDVYGRRKVSHRYIGFFNESPEFGHIVVEIGGSERIGYFSDALFRINGSKCDVMRGSCGAPTTTGCTSEVVFNFCQALRVSYRSNGTLKVSPGIRIFPGHHSCMTAELSFYINSEIVTRRTEPICLVPISNSRRRPYISPETFRVKKYVMWCGNARMLVSNTREPEPQQSESRGHAIFVILNVIQEAYRYTYLVEALLIVSRESTPTSYVIETFLVDSMSKRVAFYSTSFSHLIRWTGGEVSSTALDGDIGNFVLDTVVVHLHPHRDDLMRLYASVSGFGKYFHLSGKRCYTYKFKDEQKNKILEATSQTWPQALLYQYRFLVYKTYYCSRLFSSGGLYYTITLVMSEFTECTSECRFKGVIAWHNHEKVWSRIKGEFRLQRDSLVLTYDPPSYYDPEQHVTAVGSYVKVSTRASG